MTDDSGKVPQSEIDRAKSDIVEAIRRHLPIKKTGKNWSACCPFHQENSASFTVSEEKQMFYCFGCGESGDAVDFVVKHTGASFRQAVESINGGLSLESSATYRPAVKRAVQCSLPGHAEDREKTARVLHSCDAAYQHQYLLRNNTAPDPGCLVNKGKLLVLLINNIGEKVNMAAIDADGSISYAAGAPSFGSTAIIDPVFGPTATKDSISQRDSRTIICADYAHAWRIWWAQSGRSRVLCAMSADNLSWMLANCRDRFTHVGCDPSQSDEYQDMGHEVVTLPIDPYTRVDRPAIVRQSLMA
jgi:phage/plasmid primase-like uncharacterized protein